MIVASYKGKKFFRCSYLIRQFYKDETLQESPPDEIQLSKLYREINVNKPIVKLYELVWEEGTEFQGVKLGTDNFEEIDMFGENPEPDSITAAENFQQGNDEQTERIETLKALQGS